MSADVNPFGFLSGMRSSTPEEIETHSRMMARLSTTLVPEEELDEIKSENADLRGLLLDTWHLLQEVHGRHSTEMGVAQRMAKLHQRMIKLGVE